MHTRIPVSIVVDEQGNRWVGPSYKPLKLPPGHNPSVVNPMVMAESGDIKDAIEAYREGNQKRVNELLSKYY